MHMFVFSVERLGETKGSLIGHFSADKSRMDFLITYSRVVELFKDFESMPSSWERRIIAEQKLASANQNQGI